jgi:predicted ArsR family transcriptional regulator
MKLTGPGQAPAEAPSRREQVLTTLRAARDPLSINAIAERLGVHPNTVRFHLDGLVEAGRVEQLSGDVIGPGRPANVYRARREMDRNGPSNYRLLARIMTSRLAETERRPTAAATDLGRTWGPSLIGEESQAAATRTAALTRLTNLLDDLGFKPERGDASRARQIRLRHCPFLDLVDDHADIVCALHLGLMQGALTALDAPVTVDQLDRFVEPDLCVAHVAPAARSSGSR